MDHFIHLVDLVGIDHVTFGPDTLFGDHVGLHDAFAATCPSGRPTALSSTRRWRTSTVWRTRPSASTTSSAGWSSTATPTTKSAVVGGNIVRVLEEVWV